MKIQNFDFININNNLITLDGISLNSLQTPSIVYSAERIKNNILILKNSLEKYNYKICFALKCCYNYDIHRVMIKNKIDCEVMSELEFDIAIKSGFNAKNIIVNGVGKTESELRKYIKNDVYSINIDSMDDLKLLKKVSKKLKKNVNVGIRIKTDISADVFVSANCKLGLNIDDGEAEAVLFEIVNEKMFRLKQVGFHMLSRFVDLSLHELIIPKIADWLNYIHSKYKITFSDVNFGGGLESRVIIEESSNNGLLFLDEMITKFSKLVNYKINRFVFEPGRFIISDSAICITKVEAIKNKWVFVDIPTSFLVPLQLANFFTFDTTNKKNKSKYNIADGSCSPSSVISRDAQINKPKIGDKLIVTNCGAYTFPFCSVWYRELPEIFLVRNQKIKNIFSKKQNNSLIRSLYKL